MKRPERPKHRPKATKPLRAPPKRKAPPHRAPPKPRPYDRPDLKGKIVLIRTPDALYTATIVRLWWLRERLTRVILANGEDYKVYGLNHPGDLWKNRYYVVHVLPRLVLTKATEFKTKRKKRQAL